jgi:endogenous inhibitor of DNA gyrase (YacG/DUF329 family)
MNAPASIPARHVPCPTCKGPALFSAENRWRPFCSARCRNVDLGAWASEQFRLPVENTAEQPTPDDPT